MGGMFFGLLTSLFGALFNNFLNRKETDYAREQNYEFGEKAAENADTRTRNLYTDLQSVPAQVKQVEEAGLSPSLFYGTGTGGGVTAGAQGSGANGISPAVFGINAADAAQINLASSQAELNKAKADEIRGKTPLAQATLDNILADTGLKQEQTHLTNTQNVLAGIDAQIAQATTNEQIDTIVAECEYAKHNSSLIWYAVQNADIQLGYEKEIFDTKVELMKQDLQNKMKDFVLKTAEIQHLNVDKARLGADIERIYNDLFYYDEKDLASVRTYNSWLNKQIEKLGTDIEYIGKQYRLENTRTWLNFGMDITKTAGHIIGLWLLGKGGAGGGAANVIGAAGAASKSVYYKYGASGAGAYNPHRVESWYGF